MESVTRDRPEAVGARRSRAGLVAAIGCAVLLAGCVFSPAPFRPPTWSETAPAAPPVAAAAPGRLQVIIGYGGLMSSHSAVRLEAPGGPVFWDPAGDYGRLTLEVDPRFASAAMPARRVADRLRDPPNLETYVEFRWAMEDVGVEVFEWDLSAARAEALRGALLGRGRDARGRTFGTRTTAPLCAVATSRFLRRYGHPAIRLDGTFLFPHALARALYSAGPSRVMLFAPGRAVRVYAPPASAGPGPPPWSASKPAATPAP